MSSQPEDKAQHAEQLAAEGERHERHAEKAHEHAEADEFAKEAPPIKDTDEGGFGGTGV